MSTKKDSILDKLNDEIKEIRDEDIKSGSPKKGWAKIIQVLQLSACTHCPYAKLHKYPGKDDVVAVYKCDASGRDLVITEAVVLGRKSADCPIHKLSENMAKAREEMRKKFEEAMESGQAMVPPEVGSK